MLISTTVNQEIYTKYLNFKFRKSRLPRYLLNLYKWFHYFKNILTNYSYPREYKYKVNENGITKMTGSSQRLYSWNNLSNFEVVDSNIAFYSNNNLALYVYAGVNFNSLIEECNKYLKIVETN